MSLKTISGVGVLACATMLLAACGGSSGNPDRPAATTTSSGNSTSSSGNSASASSSTPSPSPTATPATAAQLKKIVLQPADLPGWKATPAEPDSPSDASDQAKLVACAGGKNTDADKLADVSSDDFALGDATVSSSASSYKSQSDLDADIALLHSPKLSTCYQNLAKSAMATSLPAGTTIDSVSVKVSPGPGTGPANVAGAGVATVMVRANGQQVPVYVSFAYITGPLIEAEVDTENVGTPVPPATVQALVTKVAERAANG
ncbi:MAG: hypothetical protein ACJ74U_09895 [Jatrophihabitantaceae bacterium]